MPPFGVNETAGATTQVVQGGASLPGTIPAGAVIEIRGNYTKSHTLTCAGTAQSPSFIRGAVGAVVTGDWDVKGTYCVVEKLKFGSAAGLNVLAPASHIAVRDSEFQGVPPNGCGGLWVQTWSSATASNVVLLRNKVHQHGDWQANFDQDCHGTGLYRSSGAVSQGGTISNVWILDSEYSYNSGDGVQINGNSYTSGNAKLHHVYIGRNVAHHNKQSGFWSKMASDVIFSQNEAYEHRPSDSSSGQGMGFQYAPERVWFLFNRVHDCDYGIQIVSDDSGTGKNAYLVGNVLYRIGGSGDANDPYQPAAIHIRGSTNRYVVNNTIHASKVDINSPSGNGTLYMANNIFGAPTDPQGRHILLANGSVGSAHHNLFVGTAKIKWGTSYSSLGAFKAAHPSQCAGCLEGQPTFANAAGGDFRLLQNSVGVDGAAPGVVEGVYTTFASLYGIDIKRDAAGRTRALGASFDLGAYETDPFRDQAVWHPFFAVNTLETPYVGDFNGDGRTDIITFTRQNPLAVGDVYAALSDGTKFADSTKWHDWFAINDSEQVVIGDYDGDGKDDIATWLGTTTRQAYVAPSFGTGMAAAAVWVNSIGFDPTDILIAGDVNGDGRDDLVLFARKLGKVYVALSEGSKFASPTVWHNFFAVSTYERPGVADLDGDGKSDIVTFATDSPTAFGDVYVALSTGLQFGDKQNASKWHDWFAIRQTETVRVGDLDGDGAEDFFTFLPPPFAQCYTSLSLGTAMGPAVLWPESVAPDARDRTYIGDADGDGKADVIIFAQAEGKVYVSLAR